MKKLLAAVTILTGTAFGVPVWADGVIPAPSSAPSTTGGMIHGQIQGNSGTVSKSDLIGKRLLDSQGEQVGEVKDVVTGADGRPIDLIISRGGKQVALPASEITLAENDTLKTDRTAASIEKLPPAPGSKPAR